MLLTHFTWHQKHNEDQCSILEWVYIKNVKYRVGQRDKARERATRRHSWTQTAAWMYCWRVFMLQSSHFFPFKHSIELALTSHWIALWRRRAMLTRSTITIHPAPWCQSSIDMVMSGTFQGQGLRPWVLCDPPSPKRTDLQGIVISPVMALSDQDKLFHGALALSLSCYCGHVNGHFHHNCSWFWQYCSAGPSFSLFFSASPP